MDEKKKGSVVVKAESRKRRAAPAPRLVPAVAGEERVEPSPDHAEEAFADISDDAVPTRTFSVLPTVGIGGSAGGLTALQTFFVATPADTGMVFVVVMHLAANHESMLAEIIQRSTEMPVTQVEDSAKVEANHVYVIPPGKTIASANGYLHCADIKPEHGRRVAVDLFFRTLADTHGAHAAAIVVSGADGDGAIGIKRVKERGGLTIAQDPDEAEHAGMPRAAIATGMIDWVLSVAEMPARLGRYNELLERVELPPEDGPQLAQERGPDADERESALRDVLSYLRTHTGRDFSYYKRATILRRIARRMRVNNLEQLPAYLAFMRAHPGETGALLKDMLISVTNFFRDRDAFDALTAQIPALFEGKSASDEVRVWVAACASGEEAYSIAMLLAEHARTLDAAPAILVFATDLDEDAIRIARDGVYPAAIAADVSQERLRRFFVKDHRGFRVRGELRETVIFAIHDLLKDAPFSRLDLFSCRNLLIYLNREAQARALEIAHFGLRAGGRLFLGASETVDGSEALFSVLDKRHRLYEPRPLGRPRLLPMSGQTTLARSLELHDRNHDGPPPGLGLPSRFTFPAWSKASPGDLGFASWRDLHLKLIERLAPPSIVVTPEFEIVHMSEQAGRFLEFAGGEPNLNLLAVAKPSIAVDLRSALLRARDSGASAETPPLALGAGDSSAAVVVRVAQADDLAAGYLLVTFDPRVVDAALPLPAAADDAYGRRLEQQADELKWQLRALAEHGDSQAQELKANNEELQAMNEELRSATEELETSREELQSINEELTTVNHELKSNVDELGRANGDLHNLMASTAIATVFLNRAFHITLFTPSAVTLFNLIASDVGRPLSDLANKLDYPQMAADARRVLDELISVEREVRGDTRWFLARALPYRSGEDRIAGVVFTFLDITSRRLTEDALRESEERFRTIVSQASAGVVNADFDGRITLANQRYGELVGYPTAALVGSLISDLVHPDDRERSQAAFRRMREDGERFEMEMRYVRRDGSVMWVNSAANMTRDRSGESASAVVVVFDITQRKDAEAALRESEERLRMVLDNAREYAIVSMDLERRVVGWNSGAERLLGFGSTEIAGQHADLIFTDEDRAAGAPYREAQLALAEDRAVDERFHQRKDGSRFWGSGVMMAMRDETGKAIGLLKILRDQTDARANQQALVQSRIELEAALLENQHARAESEASGQAKDRFLAILSHELRTPLTPVVMAVHALERAVELPTAVRGTLEVIRRNVRAEIRLIDDLLDVTRISSGKLELLRAPCDVHHAIHAAAEVAAGDFEAKQQRLTLQLDAQRFIVDGDGSRLEQVFWNLLKNAAKFTPKGGSVKVVTKNVGTTLVSEVIDSGVGIEPAALQSIFDAFAQEGNGSRANSAAWAWAWQLPERRWRHTRARCRHKATGVTAALLLRSSCRCAHPHDEHRAHSARRSCRGQPAAHRRGAAAAHLRRRKP